MKSLKICLMLLGVGLFVNANAQSPWWNLPLAEAEQDIKVLVDISNQKEQRELLSNSFLSMESVSFDDKEKLVKYVLRMRTNENPQSLVEFYNKQSEDFGKIDCMQNNFYHPQIGNQYELQDVYGNVVGRTITKYSKCSFENSILRRPKED